MEGSNVRWGWLKFMYAYTIVGAGSIGLGIIFAPGLVRSTLGWPKQDPVMFGVTGSVYIAFALLSILGLRSPLKFAPVLLLQLCYKVIWLVGVMLPLAVTGCAPAHAGMLAAIFATYVIGDVIAIPFRYVFAREPRPE
jgi:hypothetical protein